MMLSLPVRSLWPLLALLFTIHFVQSQVCGSDSTGCTAFNAVSQPLGERVANAVISPLKNLARCILLHSWQHSKSTYKTKRLIFYTLHRHSTTGTTQTVTPSPPTTTQPGLDSRSPPTTPRILSSSTQKNITSAPPQEPAMCPSHLDILT